ncbi:protein SCO1/2 [Flavobacterium segetis]|uniref:Protein SCO1/2 n=1 Tax=Flavobacterium segetis TaxID=271157 RepID=A0A1M5EAB9_9FLAO|nr:SCO family protein [Flavobacterium segetis]SHF76084.1 protein SCO1/2 [Flavobacterium segetis]
MKLTDFNFEIKKRISSRSRISFKSKSILYILICFLFLSFYSCTNKTETKPIIEEPISELSIYNLPSKWTNEEGENLEIKDLKGKVLVMVMIYTSCKAACPRLVADMRNIEQRIPEKIKDHVKFVLVSIDPEVDTPQRLKAFAIENKMDGDQWTFLRSSEENTREFAAVLAVNYKKIAPLDFSHSNIISVFNAKGELAYQQEGLGVNSDQTIDKILEEAEKLN